MSEDWRDDEVRRREEAQAHAGEVIEGSGSRGTPRRMDQMISVRLEAGVIAKLKPICEERGITLSEAVRSGVKLMITTPKQERDYEAEIYSLRQRLREIDAIAKGVRGE